MAKALTSHKEQDLNRAESDILSRLGNESFDFGALAAVSNIYRAATTIRNHMEQTVLNSHDLSWGAFTVLWVLWIWGDQETRHLASEAGVTKGTLTGIVKTLEKRGLVQRSSHDEDRRLVVVSLTRKGTATISKLFPEFNRHEGIVTASLTESQRDELAGCLRTIIRTVEDSTKVN
ncbi:MAG: MarR family winged helix-turn-helix transcriptional regulator [Acidimicrobiales bacterium]